MPWQVLPTKTEIIAIHAALLTTNPEGDILFFGDWAGINANGAPPTHCRLYHMASQTVERFATGDAPSTNAFCGGQAFMARGWPLVAGGTVRRPNEMAADVHDALHHWDGERACSVYQPDTRRGCA